MTRGTKERSTDWKDLPKGRGQHVLVVDDEAALARLVQENLSELRYLAEAFSSSTWSIVPSCVARPWLPRTAPTPMPRVTARA